MKIKVTFYLSKAVYEFLLSNAIRHGDKSALVERLIRKEAKRAGKEIEHGIELIGGSK